MPIKEKVGDRGKYAEDETKKVLEAMNNKWLAFAYERLPDSRSARNAIKKQLCDYLVWFNKLSIMLEVKSTEHSYRLAKDKIEQLPRLRKVAAAGGVGWVLVLHKVDMVWRVVPLSFFTPGQPSWDLRNFKTFPSAKEALLSTGIFPPV